MPVGGGQLADVLRPVAHDARQVAGVAQAPHGDAVQVHGLDEVAEEGTLQPQHVPPAGRWASAGHGTHLATAPAAWAPPGPASGGGRPRRADDGAVGPGSWPLTIRAPSLPRVGSDSGSVFS